MIFGWPALLSAWSGSSGVVPETPRAVVYEVNLRAFGPDPSLKRVTASLPRIRDLGVNVLWLMPIQPVGRVRSAGGLGSPYAIQNYETVSPEFGDARDVRDLVQTAHGLHMAVILDWAADHTSWDNPWITEHPDWYLHDARGDISAPPGTGWNDVAALDYRSKPMRNAMIAAMSFWIGKFGFDGFRCDSADRMPYDFWKRAIGTLRTSAGKPLFMLAEGHRTDDYRAGFDLTYGWGFSYRLREVFSGKSATELAHAATEESKDLRPDWRRLNFITNHDYSAWEGSLREFYKTAEGAKTAFEIAALYGGDPLIYTGQEVDYDRRIPIFQDTAIDWSKNRAISTWIAQLLDLRRKHPALLTGTTVDRSTDDVAVFCRTKGSDQVLVIANVRDRAESAPIDPAWQGEWKDGLKRKLVDLDSQVSLPPYGRLILLRQISSSSDSR
jgi:glycosidase